MKTLFFELGTEEIPARLCERARQGLVNGVRDRLQELGLATEDLESYATPRRLALALRVQAKQDDVTREMTGPPARIAFDGDGNPTKAAEAFAKRNEVPLDALTTVSTDKGDYLAATVHTPGKHAADVLPSILSDTVMSLNWPKAMRWGAGTVAFIRPIHWIIATLDGELLPMSLAGVQSGTQSRGHRFMAPDTFEATDLETWKRELRSRFVEPDVAVRRDLIATKAHTLAEEAGGTLVMDDGLLEELTYLAEWPVPLLGKFDPAFLELPAQVLVTSMRSHQKYAAVRRDDGTLSNHFILVAGLESTEPEIVVQGNRRVLAARLSDARFFVEQDTRRPLADYISSLETRIYLKGLGTMADKAERLGVLAGKIAGHLTADAAVQNQSTEAGRLAKADLSTAIVGEFASLQGEMGTEYALREGIDAPIAQALGEHYLPKHASDRLPEAIPSIAVALADRCDHLVGCFALGYEPTGSADPYALRRSALAVLRILMASQAETLTLSKVLHLAFETYGEKLEVTWQALEERLMTFLRGRLKHFLAGQFPTDLTEAVLSAGFDNPRHTELRLAALARLKQTEGWDDLAAAVKRIVRIAPEGEVRWESSTLTEAAAIALSEATDQMEENTRQALREERYDDALASLKALKPAIDRFFDEVMVMSEVPEERARRQGLVARIAGLFGAVADFDKVST